MRKKEILRELGFNTFISEPLEDKQIQRLLEKFFSSLKFDPKGYIKCDPEIIHVFGKIFGPLGRLAPSVYDSENSLLILSAFIKPSLNLFVRAFEGKFEFFNFKPNWEKAAAYMAKDKINLFHNTKDFKRLQELSDSEEAVISFKETISNLNTESFVDHIFVKKLNKNWGAVINSVKIDYLENSDQGFISNETSIKKLKNETISLKESCSIDEIEEKFFELGSQLEDIEEQSSFRIIGFISLDLLASISNEEFIREARSWVG
jgi:hypothetical protein